MGDLGSLLQLSEKWTQLIGMEHGQTEWHSKVKNEEGKERVKCDY